MTQPRPADAGYLLPMSRNEAASLAIVVVLYLGLAVAFVRAAPVLEVSDEGAHFGFVIDWRRTGELPRGLGDANVFSQQEAFQPPLYYLLVRAATADIELDDAAEHYAWIAGSPLGRADLPGPRNMHVPVPPRGTPPGTGDAVLRGRVVSTILSLVTVLLTWACARAAGLQPWQRLFATGLVAFNPMFLHIGTSVNNDALVTMLGAAATWACLTLLDRRITRTRALGLGALVGLATLAKLSGAIFAPAVAWVVLRAVREGRAARATIAWAPAGFFAVTGWWFALQHRLYGVVLTGTLSGAEIGNVRSPAQPLALVREWEGFFKSFWGVFGGFNIIYPDWAYGLMLALTLALIAAAGMQLARQPRDATLHLLVGVVALNLVAVAYWTSLLTASQGRLMFPALAAIAVASGAALDALPHRLVIGFAATALAGLLAAAAYAGLWLIPTSYVWIWPA